MFAVMGYKTDSYTEIKRLVQKMNALSFWRDADTEDGDDELITFFDSDTIRANEKAGVFHAAFSKKIRPYIFHLQIQKDRDGKFYTTYALQYVVLMKHYYSQRLYELLKSYQYNNKKWNFELGTGSSHDLFRRLAPVDRETQKPVIPESWYKYAAFSRDVLRPAERDINLLTDIKIKFVPSKIDFSGVKHRRYIRVTFAMVPKTRAEMESTEAFIDRQYLDLRMKERNGQAGQLELEDFLQKQESKLKKESGKKSTDPERKRAEELSRRSARSKTPVLTSVIGSWFTDKQIDALYRMAVKQIPDGTVREGYFDVWSCDYIKYYLDKILASPEKTKTSLYGRLLNQIEKDYDKEAGEIAERYSDHHALDRYLNEYDAISE